MKITLEIDRKWSSADLAFHFWQITTVYRVEMLSGLKDDRLNEIISEDPLAFGQYLYGGFPLGRQLSLPDIHVVGLSLASPLVETFEGAVRGLTGIAGLFEKLAFYRNTKQTKDVELERLKLKLMSEKLEALERITQIMRSNGAQESDTRAVSLAYLRTIQDLGELVEYGQLTSISRTVSVNESRRDTESDESQADAQSDLGIRNA